MNIGKMLEYPLSARLSGNRELDYFTYGVRGLLAAVVNVAIWLSLTWCFIRVARYAWWGQ